jgi:hypothetical protein
MIVHGDEPVRKSRNLIGSSFVANRTSGKSGRRAPQAGGSTLGDAASDGDDRPARTLFQS